MVALLVVSSQKAKELIAKGVAKRVRDSKKRVYFAYGSTNQLILSQLGIEVENYYNGYIANGELRSNKTKPNIVILNGEGSDFVETISADDIVIKGANTLSFENGEYRAGVAVASPQGGTYGNVLLKASCIGAEVIIPVSHEKLVPKLLSNRYTQSSFDISMGLPVALLPLTYGDIYTEIEAFKELFNLKAEIYLAGGVDDMVGSLTFVVEGKQSDILDAKREIDDR
jgi:hypothetical protein